MVTDLSGRGLLRRPFRSPGRVALIAVGCSFALAAQCGATALAATPPATLAAASIPASLSDDIEAAKAQLAAASKAVDAADNAVDAATAKMPAANAALAKAEAAYSAAQQAVEVANQAVATAQAEERAANEKVAQAKAAVAAQQVKVDKAQAEMDALKNQIAVLARQTYISGGSYTELEILLDSQDPSRFAEQMVAVKRVSQKNAELFAALAQKQQALAATMVTLKELQDAAAEQERIAQAKADEVRARAQEVQDRAQDAQRARDAAQASKQAVAELVAAAEAKRNEALALRRKLAETYNQLQAKLTHSSGVTKTSGTRRSPAEAIAWGMKYVGSGGWYDGLCLGFVDDAYDPIGSRMPAAIQQWYRAKRAGYGHSAANRNPPLGAQLFWETPGYAPGHVAMYAGGGMILTTSAFGGRVGLRTWSSMEAWLGPPVGWAEPYYP